jgi:hypothetical protein
VSEYHREASLLLGIQMIKVNRMYHIIYNKNWGKI